MPHTHTTLPGDFTNVSTCGFTRTGYHLHDGGEWNKNTSGTGTGFDQNVSYTAAQYLAITNNTYFTSKSLNLYVDWDKNTYTVAYKSNGGTGTTASQSMSYDTAANLRSNAFTRTGYHFVRWNTKADNTGTGYSAGQSVKNLTATNGATVTLYAIWAANTYTVKFNANGGTGTMADQSYTYNVAQNLRSNAFTNGTMIFTGWNTKADGTGTTYKNAQSVKNLTAANGGTVNLYAQWSAGTYTIKYNGNGATGLSPDADPEYVDTASDIMKDHTDVPVGPGRRTVGKLLCHGAGE
ncbi:MAG: InlB B-repeat-containing protein [Eubacterium sp.]